MQNDNKELKTEFFLTTYNKAVESQRETARRIEEYIKFYLTVATAILGAIAVPFVANSPSLLTKFIISLATLALYLLGLVIFLRLVNIKVQMIIHYAWAMGNQFTLMEIVFGKHILEKRSYGISIKSLFSNQIIFILVGFLTYNSILLFTSLILVISLVLELSNFPYSLKSILLWGIFPSTAFFIASTIFQWIYLQNSYRKIETKFLYEIRNCTHFSEPIHVICVKKMKRNKKNISITLFCICDAKFEGNGKDETEIMDSLWTEFCKHKVKDNSTYILEEEQRQTLRF